MRVTVSDASAAHAKSQCEVTAVKHCAAMVWDGHRLSHTCEHTAAHNAQAGNVAVAVMQRAWKLRLVKTNLWCWFKRFARLECQHCSQDT